ncbi:hypothetical protein ACFCX4_13525, partial [Kitasatospora sp. NPDC056327]
GAPTTAPFGKRREHCHSPLGKSCTPSASALRRSVREPAADSPGPARPVAPETADAVVVRDEPAAVPAVVALSRRARRPVVQNPVIAGGFITVLVVRDLAGTLPLPPGVAGHEGSTVIVGLNGLRLPRERAWQRALGNEED